LVYSGSVVSANPGRRIVDEDGMPLFEIPNDQVAGAARQFREAADLLHKRLPQHGGVLPLLMVAAFGIELFLKSLNSRCVYEQDEALAALGGYRITAEPLQKGHPPVKLLNAIDGRIRQGLEDAYARSPVVKGKATLRNALDQYDTQFNNARYPFEDARAARGGITDLVLLLDLIADHVGSMERLTL
jgi:hypothetical protein